MRKSLLTTSLWLLGLMMAMAGPVNEQTARQLAQDFMTSQFSSATRSGELSVTRAHTGIADGDNASFYVYNSEAGFVMISGDDTTPTVLGYGEGATFEFEKAPQALQYLLGRWQETHNASQTNTRGESIPTHSKISVLLDTQWGQDAPFNKLCPATSDNKGKCPTGCVATAMAQVMYYYQWPAKYDWKSMKKTYSSSDTGTSVDAVATLMKDIGDAVFMEYADDGSGANTYMVSEAMRYDFGYAESTDYANRESYTAKEWDALMYQELKNKRPVIMGGRAASEGEGESGHEFILDGYEAKNGQGYYHVNWGWYGGGDNYYLLALLCPSSQGTGGNVGSGGFNYSVDAVIGIQPADKSLTRVHRLYLPTIFIDGDVKTFARSSTSEDFPQFKVKFETFNIVPEEATRNYDVAFSLYKSGKLVNILDEVDDLKFDFRSGYSIWANVSIGSDLSDGTYEIRALCREVGQSDWTGMLYGYDKYIELTINGKNMVATYHGAYQYDDPSFVVNSVTVGDVRQQGKAMTITVNVTDQNTYNNMPIFLWGIAPGATDYALLTGCGTNLDAGDTGDVVLEYTPSLSGLYKMALSTSSSECTLLKTFTVEVAAMSMADVELSVDVKADNSTKQSNGTYKVSGSTLAGTLTVTNKGTEDYQDNLYVYLYKGSKGSKTYYYEDEVSGKVDIAVGKTKKYSFSFENLEADVPYAIIIVAIERGEKIKVSLDSEGYIPAGHCFILTGGGTGIDGVIIDNPDADVYNLQGVKVGKVSDMERMPHGVYIVNKKKVLNK